MTAIRDMLGAICSGAPADLSSLHSVHLSLSSVQIRLISFHIAVQHESRIVNEAKDPAAPRGEQ
jgi:hypothetical protein